MRLLAAVALAVVLSGACSDAATKTTFVGTTLVQTQTTTTTTMVDIRGDIRELRFLGRVRDRTSLSASDADLLQGGYDVCTGFAMNLNPMQVAAVEIAEVIVIATRTAREDMLESDEARDALIAVDEAVRQLCPEHRGLSSAVQDVLGFDAGAI